MPEDVRSAKSTVKKANRADIGVGDSEMEISVSGGPIAEDSSPTDMPAVTIDSFQSHNEAAHGIFELLWML